MPHPAWASKKRQVLAAIAVLAALLALWGFQRSVRELTRASDRLLQGVQAVDTLRELSQQLTRLNAHAQLYSRGYVSEEAQARIQNQLEQVDRSWLKLQAQAGQWQQSWSKAKPLIQQLAALPVLSIPAEGFSLASRFQSVAEKLQEEITSLERQFRDEQARQIAAVKDWEKQVNLAAWRLMAGIGLLAFACGWLVQGNAFAVGRLPLFPQRWRWSGKPKGRQLPTEPLEQIEEQV